MTAALIVLSVVVTWLVCRHKYSEDGADLRHQRDTAIAEADYWHQAFVALSRNSSNVRSIREAPKFDLIADHLAANEAQRDLIRLDEVREMWKRDGGDPA